MIGHLVLWGLLLALGCLTELLQHLVGRQPSWSDLQANAWGATAGMLWAIGYNVRTRRWHIPAALLAVCMLLVASWRPLLLLYDAIRQPPQMPQLASFEDALELSRWTYQECHIRRVRQKATHGEWSLAVQLLPGRYPGIALVWFPSDWSSYAEISFDLTFEGPGELDLIVKIQDRQHNNQHEDRFHQSFRLQPSQHHIRIDLGQVAVAPKGRLLDLTQVTFLQLFVVNIDRPQSFYLDHVRLHKNCQKIAKDVMGRRE